MELVMEIVASYRGGGGVFKLGKEFLFQSKITINRQLKPIIRETSLNKVSDFMKTVHIMKLYRLDLSP
jgi:hypothetical protein